ncbi:MAG TPA: peroxiredoxin [Burkholderiaceae bacterium]|nr:peroxiredoxin [Burkholderiaceae bacterium]
MTAKIGDRVPDGTLYEYYDEPTGACALGPNAFRVSEMVQGKTIALFALPGAFTPTCSEKHLPGYLELAETLRDKGVDEIWCVSVNDAFVMGAWGRSLNVSGRVRMLGDGNGDWIRKLGLEMDLTARGMGVRAQRFSALLRDGVVEQLNVEQPGKFEVSDAQSLLGQL